VAWDTAGKFDETTYRSDVAACCAAGVPGVYTGGTTGEFFAMEFDEYCAITRATVDVCHAHGAFAMIGCTSTYTLGAQKRAAFAASVGADAIQFSMPYWNELCRDEVVPFVTDISAAANGLPLSIYDTGRSRVTLTLDDHAAIHRAVPNYLMVKSIGGTIGADPEGCRRLSEFLNVFVSETKWTKLGPTGANGSCSAMVYWNPRVTLGLWQLMKAANWDALAVAMKPVVELHEYLFREFGPRGFSDTAYDRLGCLTTGFLSTSLECRKPYKSPTLADIHSLRNWLEKNFPEMLVLK
jgi:dihydrodipicolinate synthase/N-acetylneuraminate lyase